MSLKFHNSLKRAIQMAKSGDKIFVVPGVYQCETLPWIEDEIDIMGCGQNNADVVIQSSDSVGDIFLTCKSNSVRISNLTFRASSDIQCILMVHSGNVFLNECVLDGTQGAKNTMIVLSKGKVILDGCNLIHADKSDGIVSSVGGIIIRNKNMETIETH